MSNENVTSCKQKVVDYFKTLPKRYFITAFSGMAQGLFCTLLVGTILNTIGQQFHIGFLTQAIVTLKDAAKNDVIYYIYVPNLIYTGKRC